MVRRHSPHSSPTRSIIPFCANFLISIREDVLAKLDIFKGPIPNLFANYLRVEHLNAEAAGLAVRKPLEVYNRLNMGRPPVAADDDLVRELIEQVGKGKLRIAEGGEGLVELASEIGSTTTARVETPFLQMALTRLWDEEARVGSYRLRLETLKATGRGGDDRPQQSRQCDGHIRGRSTRHRRGPLPLPGHAQRHQDRLEAQRPCRVHRIAPRTGQAHLDPARLATCADPARGLGLGRRAANVAVRDLS